MAVNGDSLYFFFLSIKLVLCCQSSVNWYLSCMDHNEKVLLLSA